MFSRSDAIPLSASWASTARRRKSREGGNASPAGRIPFRPMNGIPPAPAGESPAPILRLTLPTREALTW